MKNFQIQPFNPTLKDTGLQLSKVQLTTEYVKL